MVKHNVCARWKRDGGQLRCRNLLILFCESDFGIAKESWSNALHSIFEGLHVEVYTSCFMRRELCSRGQACQWHSVIKLQSPGDLNKAVRSLKSVKRKCYSISGRMTLSCLGDDVCKSIAGSSYRFGGCLAILMAAVASDGRFKKKLSFGSDDLIKLINHEVKLYLGCNEKDDCEDEE